MWWTKFLLLYFYKKKILDQKNYEYKFSKIQACFSKSVLGLTACQAPGILDMCESLLWLVIISVFNWIKWVKCSSKYHEDEVTLQPIFFLHKMTESMSYKYIMRLSKEIFIIFILYYMYIFQSISLFIILLYFLILKWYLFKHQGVSISIKRDLL